MDKAIFVIIWSLVLVGESWSLSYPIVDTGVTNFSNDFRFIRPVLPGQPFYGQDANYRGVGPLYRNNGDGTVSDLVTGLMWEQVPINSTFDEAMNMVKTWRRGGYSDWRVPSIKELYSLILFTGTTVGINSGGKFFIDSNYFAQPIGSPREIDAQTLSATQYTGRVFGNQLCIFGVNFIDGRIKCYPKYAYKYYRFVRGPTAYGVNNFVANPDNTISDLATGLMWMKTDSARALEWRDALAYCENANFAGRSDWRLPKIKELQSIVDYTRGPQTTRSAAISPLFQVTQIREPDGTMDYPYFWSSTTHMDGPMPLFAAYVAFGQAWGMPQNMGNRLLDVHGAGAQRGDRKNAQGVTTPQYTGPQGDLRTSFNFARCVRTI